MILKKLSLFSLLGLMFVSGQIIETNCGCSKTERSNKSIQKSKKMMGSSPTTWAPRITVDPKTGVTYIQTYDKKGKLGPKKVYRNRKQTAAYGETSDTLFEKFEDDVDDAARDVKRRL